MFNYTILGGKVENVDMYLQCIYNCIVISIFFVGLLVVVCFFFLRVVNDFPRVGKTYEKAVEVSKDKPVSGCFPALRLSFSCHFLSEMTG